MNGQSSSGAAARVVGGGPVAREERGRRAVHADVGALRREDHRDEQLEVVPELERDAHVRHRAREPVHDLRRRAPASRPAGGRLLARRWASSGADASIPVRARRAAAGVGPSMNRIDLRSDTVTRPPPPCARRWPAPRSATTSTARIPTVNRLQEEVAALLGKEAALFVPSGTMANQVALGALTRPGDEIVCDAGAHCISFE